VRRRHEPSACRRSWPRHPGHLCGRGANSSAAVAAARWVEPRVRARPAECAAPAVSQGGPPSRPVAAVRTRRCQAARRGRRGRGQRPRGAGEGGPRGTPRDPRRASSAGQPGSRPR
jgi:hypothetical protein